MESALKQFCSGDRLAQLVNRLRSTTTNTTASSGAAHTNAAKLIDDEYTLWMSSLERFIAKLTDERASFADITYAPANALALVAYGMRALYTRWRQRVQPDHDNSRSTHSLGELTSFLYSYPYRNSHVSNACRLIEVATTVGQGVVGDADCEERSLGDELNLLSLMHLLIETRFEAVTLGHSGGLHGKLNITCHFILLCTIHEDTSRAIYAFLNVFIVSLNITT